MRQMNNLETKLGEKMNQSDIHFDVTGADAKVLRIAHQDLLNYLKYHWNMIGKEESDFKVASRAEKLLKDEPAEFEIFLSMWTSSWLHKWGQRVKLLLGDQPQDKSRLSMNSGSSDSEALWRKVQGKQELVGLVVSSLVKNGELCATEILAENILKTELAKVTDFVNSKEQMIRLLDSAFSRARELANCVSPLIFVKVDKGYYQHNKCLTS